MTSAKILIRNFAVLFFGSVAGQVLFLFGMLHIARVAGPAGFGLWSYAQAWFFSALRMGEFGLEVTGIRAIARDSSVLNDRVIQVLMLRIFLAAGLFVCAVTAVALRILPGDAGMLVLLFCVGVFPAALTLEWLYEAVQRPLKTSIARSLKGLSFLVLVTLFVDSKEDLGLSASLYVGSLLLASLFLLIAGSREFGFRWRLLTWHEAGSLLRESWQIAVATLLSQYALFFGTILLGYTVAAEELGFFTASHRLIIFIWAYGIVTSNRVLLPTLSLFAAESGEQLSGFLRQATRLLLILALPMGTIGFSVAPGLIDLLYGPEYAQAVPIFKILIWALVLAVARSGLEINLVAAHRQHHYLRGMVFLGAFHTIFCTIGLLQWGTLGVAGAMVLAEGLYAVYLMTVSEPAVFRGLAKTVVRVIGASVAAALAITVFQTPLVVSVILGILIYAGGLLLFRETSAEDWALLRQLLGIRQR